MADSIKLIDRSVGYITWDNSELATGDVARVLQSLGRVGKSLKIETSAGSDLTVKLNSRMKVYPPLHVDPMKDHPGGLDNFYLDLSQEAEIETNAESITVGGTSVVVFEWSGSMRDIEVTYTTGTFTMYVS